MARGRLISRTLGSSRKFHDLLRVGGKLGEFCQVLFPLIVTNTDDFGRMPADAFTIKNVVLPSSRRPERDFEQALAVLAEVGLIERYQSNGGIYLQVNQFDEHQANLHKRTASRFPEFPGISGSSQNFRELPEQYKRTEFNLTESNLTELKTPLPPFEKGGRLTRAQLKAAEVLRQRVHGGCPHDPRCASYAECVAHLARELKERA